MQKKLSPTIILCALALCLTLSGCGPKLQGFSGSVTHEGVPLEKGVVIFTPDATKGNLVGASNIASIQNGRYELPVEQGISGGWYEVRVEVTEWIGGEGDSGTTKDLIPPYIFSHEFKPDDKTFDIDIPKR